MNNFRPGERVTTGVPLAYRDGGTFTRLPVGSPGCLLRIAGIDHFVQFDAGVQLPVLAAELQRAV